MDLHDRISEMLNDSVQNIFLTLQNELNIESGDCPPDLEYDIDKAIEKLAEYMKTVIEYQL